MKSKLSEKFEHPFIVLDPVDPNRNVAAAVSPDNFYILGTNTDSDVNKIQLSISFCGDKTCDVGSGESENNCPEDCISVEVVNISGQVVNVSDQTNSLQGNDISDGNNNPTEEDMVRDRCTEVWQCSEWGKCVKDFFHDWHKFIYLFFWGKVFKFIKSIF